MNLNRSVSTRQSRGWIVGALIALTLACVVSAPASAQTWVGTTDNNWFTGANWTGDASPNSNTAAASILVPLSNPVQLDSFATVGTLAMGIGTSLDINAGLGVAQGSISNAGSINLSGSLELESDVTLSGSGTLTLVNGQIGTDGNGRTLTNASTIAGYGLIGSNGAYVSPNLGLSNSGTIDANSAGNTLEIAGSGGPFTNTGTLEATAGGTLQLAAPSPWNNQNGLVLSSGTGSTVNVSGTISGGTLTTTGGGVMQTNGTADLDGSSLGAITISNGSTYTAGAGTGTYIAGTLNLGTTSAGTLSLAGSLALNGDTTFTGPGTVSMTDGQIGTDGNGRTLTNQSTIQGSGLIGSNAAYVYQNLSLNNQGTINANLNGQTLEIAGNGSSIVNSGLVEATNGGILDLASQAVVNNAGGNITANAGTVDVSTTIQGGTLNTLNGGIMQTVGVADLDASSQGNITLSSGSTYTAGAGTGTYIAGTLDLAGSSSTLAVAGSLALNGDTTLTGPGSLTLNGGQVGSDGNGRLLTNNSIIQGSGLIGSDAAYVYTNLSLTNNGTINANSTGNSLTIGGSGSAVINNNLFEATNGGVLNLSSQAAIQNGSGTILSTGAGSAVNVSTTIIGGTLTTTSGGYLGTSGAATLDGNAGDEGAITLTDGSTYTAGAGSETLITGTLNLGTTTGSTLALGGQLRLVGDTTFAGPGVVVMSSTDGETGQIGTDGNGRVLYNQATIEGSGLIGSNASDVYPNLSLSNSGTINANSNGNTLTIGGNGSFITNTGLLEATNGGTLTLASQAAVLNQGANITANAGTVNINTTIQGGTLNTLNGGIMQTDVSATLDGTTYGAITLSDGSTYSAAAGTLTYIAGTLNLGTSTGSTFDLGGQLRLVGDTTLTGPGTFVMSSVDGETGQIGTDGNGRTLYNQSTIEGSGLIGSNASNVYPNLSLINSGTINANVNGQTLGIGSNSGTIANTGLLEATNGGILNLFTAPAVNNSGGTILASGAGSTVNVNTSIQGGSLTTTGGGLMQTGTSGATLDGSTNGAITITDGSTYTAGTNGVTNALGTLNLGTSTGGTLALTAGGQLRLVGDLTLTGPGTLTLTSTNSATAQIGTDGNGRNLINESTIQGGGLIGSNVGALSQNLNVNNTASGLIVANEAGQTLQIGGNGSTTNSGTFQANAGSTLEVSNNFTNFNGGNATLTGGTYYANGGTIQLNLGGNSGGGEITTNAANITLSGASATVQDLGGTNALSALATIATNSSLTLINGQQFATAAAAFTNNGTVTVGTSGSQLNVTAGAFQQSSTGTLVEQIAGTGAGQFGLSNISGTDTLDGTLDVDLTNGFDVAANEDYAITFMYSGDAIGAFSNVICPTNDTCTVLYNESTSGAPALGDVTLDIDGPIQGTPPVPEPATFGMLLSGLASLAAGMKLRRGRTAA
jgi:fibronectin-binding autotransporter adhesin